MTQRAYNIAMIAACPFPVQRGTPIRIQRMAEALGRRGHRVHVVTYHLGDAGESPHYETHRIRPVRTYRKLSPGPTYQKLLVLDPLLAGVTKRLIDREPIDAVHAHHVEGMLVALAAARGRRRRPIVFDVHTLLQTELPYFGMGLPRSVKRWIGRRLDTVLPRRADHTIAVTEDIRDKLVACAAVKPQNASVISNGVEVDRFDEARRRGSAPNGPGRTLLFTGNLAEYQGIGLMLAAFALLRQRRQDVRLRIVSEGDFSPYESQASTLGVRDAIDVVPDRFEAVPRHLSEADVALNPRTDCDGIPQKLLNYMAAARPIVSFAGSAKMLTDGQRGLVVENDDVPGFAAAIERLLDDPTLAGRLGESARRFVDAELSWDHTTAQTEAIYARLNEPTA